MTKTKEELAEDILKRVDVLIDALKSGLYEGHEATDIYEEVEILVKASCDLANIKRNKYLRDMGK